ncbi:hypothetical protein [Teredinibacter sp. KSP-S5-2]|uniref:hypothetical protein n=1 Tax=Teredinibacter sp. KSP-S5-2 TaxID=3034506 RepID=UPI00293533DE|nr:hypothetical protein [Teredinibacter sp. KSP-S5-2]WNO08886.1 hypothetical protein P5V12_18100 [Teredinibacter sp. KSP-S5-2]
MEFGEKEKVVILAALNQYMASIEKSLNDGELDEEESADLVNDASLLEIIISRFEDEA